MSACKNLNCHTFLQISQLVVIYNNGISMCIWCCGWLAQILPKEKAPKTPKEKAPKTPKETWVVIVLGDVIKFNDSQCFVCWHGKAKRKNEGNVTTPQTAGHEAGQETNMFQQFHIYVSINVNNIIIYYIILYYIILYYIILYYIIIYYIILYYIILYYSIF